MLLIRKLASAINVGLLNNLMPFAAFMLCLK